MVITDVLIKELEKTFPAHLVINCGSWEETCRLQGALNVIQWLKDEQDEQNAKGLETTVESPVTVVNKVEPRITGTNVKNASFLEDS